MNEEAQDVFPDIGRSNGNEIAGRTSGDAVMLEGMKVLFDDKVGLYPVDLVRQAPKDRGPHKAQS